jgi:hypothetical protein
MASFLSLPQELRDEIIRLVVAAEVPYSPDATRIRMSDYRKWDDGQHVFMPKSADAYRPPALSLLYTSKRVRAETLKLIVREKVDVLVDLVFLDHVWLWPTYRIILPRTSTSLKLLVVDLSFAISDEFAAKANRFYPNCKCFFGFMHRFLSLGPVGDAGERDYHDMYVGELRINVESEKHGTGNYMFRDDEIPMREVDGFAHLTDNHKWLYGTEWKQADLWCREFDDFFLTPAEPEFDPDDPDWRGFTAVKERVGRMVLCVDGQVRGERDLGIELSWKTGIDEAY